MRSLVVAAIDWTAVGSVATAFGVAAVFMELAAGRRQQRTQLEDELSREYRAIAATFPIDAQLDRPIKSVDVTSDDKPPSPDEIGVLIRYIDLCNQQVFLRQQRRISFATWQDWHAGIRDNLTRPAVARTWAFIREHTDDSFHELAELAHCWHGDERDQQPSV